jgi:hypothetical protein
MAELIPMYWWKDRAEWHLLEALGMVEVEGGWAQVTEIWKTWQRCCRWTQVEGRGRSLSTCRVKLRKFEVLGWVEKKVDPGKGTWWRLGEKRVELETPLPGIYWVVDKAGGPKVRKGEGLIT